MIFERKQQCDRKEISNKKTASESHLHWKDQFHKNRLYFRFFVDFEADKEFNNSSIGDKTTNIYKRKLLCNGDFYSI